MSYFLPNHPLRVAEILLIPESSWYLFISRISVSFLPSRNYLPTAAAYPVTEVAAETAAATRTVCCVVNGLSRRTPWASTCLVKVLASHKMLRKRRLPHTIHLGVRKQDSARLAAHAWLSADGKVLVGGRILQDFTEISTIHIR